MTNAVWLCQPHPRLDVDAIDQWSRVPWMNTLLVAAGVLSLVIGVVHSVLGEVLIFKNLRVKSLVPTLATEPLRERNVRILWATWHLPSILGWAMGAILFELAASELASSSAIVHYIALSMLASGVLVLIATKAKHPGWVGLCGVAVLCWLA